MSEDLRERGRAGAEETFDALDELWDEEARAYGMRRTDDGLDDRLDAATFSVVDAVRAVAAVDGLHVTEADVDRVADHLRAALDGLYREADESSVAGLIRYEGDNWRTEGQDGEKVWTLATGMGAAGAAGLGALLAERGREQTAEWMFDRAAELYALLEDDGPLTTPTGYLPEQWYDDGTPDSATPLGYAHGFRLRVTATLAETTRCRARRRRRRPRATGRAGRPARSSASPPSPTTTPGTPPGCGSR